ncbi:hypothetical protein F9C28_16780 [Shimwellia pseudoproteus]|uniref:hypothetical protein n=1 Tax=Shimwellia pseudoproteus TaxID=570012 RepID=UPI0018EA42A4|nr:hypothetical protein [Shimwellia pseudoproteus]MBJ3816525.1 hypothetical protein [Shimwellia pseudoproteus]
MAIHQFPLNNATPVTIDFMLAEKTRKLIGIDGSKVQCELLPLPVSVRSITYVLRNGIDGEIFPRNHHGQRNFIINTAYKEFALVSDQHRSADNSDKFHLNKVYIADTGAVEDVDEDIFIY